MSARTQRLASQVEPTKALERLIRENSYRHQLHTVFGAGDCIFYRLPQVRRFANPAYLQAAIDIATLPALGAPSPNPALKPAHVPGAGASFSD